MNPIPDPASTRRVQATRSSLRKSNLSRVTATPAATSARTKESSVSNPTRSWPIKSRAPGRCAALKVGRRSAGPHLQVGDSTGHDGALYRLHDPDGNVAFSSKQVADPVARNDVDLDGRLLEPDACQATRQQVGRHDLAATHPHRALRRLNHSALGGKAGSPDLLQASPQRHSRREPAARRALVELCVPVSTGHDPSHELVEQRHRERRIAVAWAPDHAFDDQ